LDNQQNNIKHPLKEELGRLFWISFGIFLFVLFFQPFPLAMLSENDRLIFVTGFGGITFILACFTLIILPLLSPKWLRISEWETGPPILLSVALLILTSTAFTFYIRFVGKVPITFYISFKVVLVCLLPIIILVILYKNKSLEQIIENLHEQNKNYFNRLKEAERIEVEVDMEVYSDNKSDKLVLKYKNIVFVKSADNYIEIYYFENNVLEKKLLRGTLKNIEAQLSNIRSFIRCHRTSIVNVNYVEQLSRSYSGYNLKMNNFDEKIPVSRQYLIQVKAAISSRV
jgi:hypothetical protein